MAAFSHVVLLLLIYSIQNCSAQNESVLTFQPPKIQLTPNTTSTGTEITISCAPPAGVGSASVLAISISRVNKSQQLVELARALGTKNNGQAQLSVSVQGVSVSGAIAERKISLEMSRASCSDEGVYVCSVTYYLGAIQNAKSEKELKVEVSPGEITMASSPPNPNKVWKENDTLTLTCSGAVGSVNTTGSTNDPQIRWQWEYRQSGLSWSTYDGDDSDVNTRSLISQSCYKTQTSILTRRLTLRDSQREYRCYVVRGSQGFTQFAQSYSVGSVTASGGGNEAFETQTQRSLQMVILTSPEPFPVGPVVGAVVAVLVVIVIVVIVIVWRRRRHSHNPPKPQSTGTPSSNTQRIPTDNRRALPKIAEDVQQIQLEDRLHDRKAVSMDLFPARMDALHQDSNRHFLREYQELLKMADSMKKTYTAQVGELPVNSIKNRNQEVLPYDHTRVKLFAREEGGQDYINASYVKGLRSPCDYIATQAPLISTVLDFWKMVWEQRSSLIIMLSEDTQSGTELYWPNKINRPVRYGDVEVTLSSVSVRSLYTARQLTLQANGEEVSVTQYQLHGWQAASARRPLTQVCDVLSAVTPSTAATTTAPVIVHCSDGTAATCTFIVLDILQGYIKNHGLGEDMDVFTIILNIVKCRPALLQSEAQYMFIHDVARVMVERKKREGQNKGNVYENAEPGQSSVYDTTYVYVEDSRHYETLGEVKEKVSGV